MFTTYRIAFSNLSVIDNKTPFALVPGEPAIAHMLFAALQKSFMHVALVDLTTNELIGHYDNTKRHDGIVYTAGMR